MRDTLYFYIEIRLKYEKNILLSSSRAFSLKTVLFVRSRAFTLSTPTFSLSTPMENSEATWKKLQNATNHLPQTSQENFLNKFRLWLLRIESECVFPVLPAPSELKELIGLV